MWHFYAIFVNITLINKLIMEIINEETKTERNFSKYITDIFNGDVDCKGGIIAPNIFSLDIEEDKRKKGEAFGYEFYKTLYLKRNYSTINSVVWNELTMRNNLLAFQIVGYISNIIKYDSNIVRIQYDSIRSITRKDINGRDFKNTFELLEHINIIRKTDLKGIYLVNPAMIFKGNIDRLVKIITDSKFSTLKIKDSNVCLDKILTFEHYKSDYGTIIKNGKYHTKYKNVEDANFENIEIKEEKMIEKKVKKEKDKINNA